MRTIKRIALHIGVFAAAVLLMWGLLMLAVLIPQEKIRDNMLKSAEYYNGRQPFSLEDGSKLSGVADNFADTILLNITWNMSGSALDTKYYDGNDGVTDSGENWGLYSTVAYGTEPNTDYTRYWHGSAMFIRPLLLVTDAEGIKRIGSLAVLALVIAVCALLLRDKQYFAAAAFTAGLCLVRSWNIRLALEYIPIFLVTAAACLMFVIFEKKGDTWLTVLSVITGAAAAFFDFLTAETLSILLPLMLVFIIRQQDGRGKTLRENLVLSLKCGIGWGISYVMTFVTKWTLATVVTGENKFTSAIRSAETRISGINGYEMMTHSEQAIYAPLANLSAMFGGSQRVDVICIVMGLTVSAALLGGMLYIFFARTKNGAFTAVMLILGALPYLRFIVLNNHSYLHSFFTYRAQAASVTALLAVIWFNIELRKYDYDNVKKKAVKRR